MWAAPLDQFINKSSFQLVGFNIFMLMYFLGFIWAEIKQMWDGGFQDYIHDWWNLMDFVMNSLYLATISLKIVAYTKVAMYLYIMWIKSSKLHLVFTAFPL